MSKETKDIVIVFVLVTAALLLILLLSVYSEFVSIYESIAWISLLGVIWGFFLIYNYQKVGLKPTLRRLRFLILHSIIIFIWLRGSYYILDNWPLGTNAMSLVLVTSLATFVVIKEAIKNWTQKHPQ